MILPVAILAGGLATRLRPLTEKIPKSLIEIAGKPFLDHQLQLLTRAGFREVVICVGFLGEMIKAFADDGSRWGLKIHYSFDGEYPLGTGGSLRKALPFLGESFFILYGDSYLPCDYLTVEKAYFKKNKLGLMTIYHNKNEGDKSNIYFSNGRIIEYDKTRYLPTMEYIDYGLGVLHYSAVELCPVGAPMDLADIYKKLIEVDQLLGYEVFNRFYEIGSFHGITELENYLQSKR